MIVRLLVCTSAFALADASQRTKSEETTSFEIGAFADDPRPASAPSKARAPRLMRGETPALASETGASGTAASPSGHERKPVTSKDRRKKLERTSSVLVGGIGVDEIVEAVEDASAVESLTVSKTVSAEPPLGHIEPVHAAPVFLEVESLTAPESHSPLGRLSTRIKHHSARLGKHVAGHFGEQFVKKAQVAMLLGLQLLMGLSTLWYFGGKLAQMRVVAMMKEASCKEAKEVNEGDFGWSPPKADEVVTAKPKRTRYALAVEKSMTNQVQLDDDFLEVKLDEKEDTEAEEGLPRVNLSFLDTDAQGRPRFNLAMGMVDTEEEEGLPRVPLSFNEAGGFSLAAAKNPNKKKASPASYLKMPSPAS